MVATAASVEEHLALPGADVVEVSPEEASRVQRMTWSRVLHQVTHSPRSIVRLQVEGHEEREEEVSVTIFTTVFLCGLVVS